MNFNRHTRLVFGATRIVLLYGNRAYKIPTVRTIVTIFHFIKYYREKGLPNSCSAKTSKKTFRTIVGSVYNISKNFLSHIRPINSGWTANRREYRRWQRLQSDSLAPVLSMHLCGFLLVQSRANQVSSLPDKMICVADTSGDGGLTDNRPPNFGFFHGRLVWVDYGGPECPKL